MELETRICKCGCGKSFRVTKKSLNFYFGKSHEPDFFGQLKKQVHAVGVYNTIPFSARSLLDQETLKNLTGIPLDSENDRNE